MKNKNNEQMKVDLDAYEEARYQDILNSGKYAEARVIVGTEKTTINGIKGNLPCMHFKVSRANSETIAIFYEALKLMVKHVENEYPIECALASIACNSTDLGSFDIPVPKKKRGRKKKGDLDGKAN